MLLSAIGLLLSVGSHLAALAGIPMPGGNLVWGLHGGIFVVWLPTVWIANRMARHGRRSDFWKLALSGCPNWARYFLYALFAYAILNFLYGMSVGVGRGKPNEAEGLGSEVRLFSGHWMVFYGAAFATLYSAIKRPELLRSHKCERGHDVSALDEFCSKCGVQLGQRSGKA